MLTEQGLALQHTRAAATVQLDIEAPADDSAHMTRFMTASVLPFLILALLAVNSGWWWVMESERNTLNGFLVAPVPRPALIAGPVLASVLVSTVVLLLALLTTRRLVSWPWPARPLQFCCLAAGTMLMAAGLTFVQAALCRSIMLFGDVTAIGLFVLFFSSAVVTPVETMADWQRWLAHMIPTYYAVRGLRAAAGGIDVFRWRDIAILVAWGAAGLLYGGLLLNRTMPRRSD
jgi:ABC-type multidrug transport system permease subunit